MSETENADFGGPTNLKAETPTVQTPEMVYSKDLKAQGSLEIRADNGSAGRLEIYFRHPVLADVVEKMGISNFGMDDFDPVYKPILLPHPDPKARAAKRCVTRTAIYNATKNFRSGTDFDFAQPPCGILICNPEALRQGFSLFIELKAPVPTDTQRKWGKQLVDGCNDIISSARPYTMAWVFKETTPTKL